MREEYDWTGVDRHRGESGHRQDGASGDQRRADLFLTFTAMASEAGTDLRMIPRASP
jgi:hypothetical protein